MQFLAKYAASVGRRAKEERIRVQMWLSEHLRRRHFASDAMEPHAPAGPVLCWLAFIIEFVLGIVTWPESMSQKRALGSSPLTLSPVPTNLC